MESKAVPGWANQEDVGGGSAPGNLATGERCNVVWRAEKGRVVCAVNFAKVGLPKGASLAAVRGVAGGACFEAVALRCFRAESAGFDLLALLYPQIPLSERQPTLQKAAQAVVPGGIFLSIADASSDLTDDFCGPRNSAGFHAAERLVSVVEHELPIERAHTVERIVAPAGGLRGAMDRLVRGRSLS